MISQNTFKLAPNALLEFRANNKMNKTKKYNKYAGLWS